MEGATQSEAGHVGSTGAAVGSGSRDQSQAAGPGGAAQSQGHQHQPGEVRGYAQADRHLTCVSPFTFLTCISACSKLKEVEERSRETVEQMESLKKEMEDSRSHSNKGTVSSKSESDQVPARCRGTVGLQGDQT